MRLLYDANNKCIATNMLDKVIFQDHTDQKSGLFQDRQPISGLLQAGIFSFLRTRGNPANSTKQKQLSISSRFFLETRLSRCMLFFASLLIWGRECIHPYKGFIILKAEYYTWLTVTNKQTSVRINLFHYYQSAVTGHTQSYSLQHY